VSLRFEIPADLRVLRQWVVYRRELRDGKATKVPYRADKPGVRASTTDVRTWGLFEQACRAVEAGKADGAGFVFSAQDPFCGVDLDECVASRSHDLKVAARRIVELLNSYTEWSPSGRGVHVIVRGRLGPGRNRKGPIEIYDHGRYFAMTGERLPGMPHSPLPRQRELDELRTRLFPPPPTRRPQAPRVVLGDDRKLLESAFRARNGAEVERLWQGDTSGYSSHSEADLALCAHLAFWAGGDPVRVDQLFRRSGLYREKWERSDYRERTIALATERGGSE
jgi:putative DNA primase/helicase